MDVTVVDVESGRPALGRAVVDGPTITAVIAAEGYAPTHGATMVPARGKYLIPRFWDMHVHHTFPWPGFHDLMLFGGVTT